MKRFRVTIETGKLKGKYRDIWATDKKAAIEFALSGCPANERPMASACVIVTTFKVGDKYPVGV